MVLVVAWTMVYEVAFFLVFALMLFHRRLGGAAFLAWGCGIVLFTWLPADWSNSGLFSSFVFNHQFLRFMAGMGVYVMLHRWRIPWPRIVVLLGVAIFLIAATFDALDRPLPLASACCYTLASALLISGLVEAECCGLVRAPKALAYLGDAAYAIYLVHFPVLSVTAKVAKLLNLDHYLPNLVLFALHVAVALGVGCLAYHFVENPLHLWQKRFFRRAKTPVALATPIVCDVRKAA